MRLIGICTSSRSERHLMESVYFEMNKPQYKIKPSMVNLNEVVLLGGWDRFFDWCKTFDVLIIPADRSEMTKFALECFHRNIPFCHYLAGSQTYSYTHDDTNRWLISLMASYIFAESPQARDNLINAGQPKDRVMVTGTSHFDGITNYDIEANTVSYSPRPFDLILMNSTTQTELPHYTNPTELAINEHYIVATPNEDNPYRNEMKSKQWSRLQFLWLLKHCDHFISNSSSIHYEVPWLNKFCGANIKVINHSQRNAERTPIDPMYCKGASKIIAEWCATVDLEWLKTPKRLWQ